jgi:uncharacterized protein (DUF427 family)
MRCIEVRASRRSFADNEVVCRQRREPVNAHYEERKAHDAVREHRPGAAATRWPTRGRQQALPRSVREPDMAVDPDAEHRIDIVANRHRVRVIHGGITIADTHSALTLSETGYSDVIYFPRADVNMARLERSTRTSRCPYKGEASYFHLRTESGRVEDVAWSYEAPLESVGGIKGYLAFYASRVDRIDQTS